MKKILVGISLMLAFASGLRAQETQLWTLTGCIDYALENSITVKQSQVQVSQSELDLSSAKFKFLPGLSGSARQGFDFGRGLTGDNVYQNSGTISSTSFNLGADITVFQGLQLVNNLKISKLNLAAATADLDKIKDDIRVNVAAAFVKILYDKQIFAVALDKIKIDSMQVARLESMVENGMASASQVSSQKATLVQSRLAAVQAENNMKLDILSLTQLLELTSPEGFDIIEPSLDSFKEAMLMTPEEIFAEAVEIKPVIAASKYRLQSAELNIKYAKGAYSPTLSASAGIGANYNSAGSTSFGEQMKNNFSQSVGLTLSVPIFTRMQTTNNVKAAKLRYHNEELSLAKARKDLYQEIQQAYYNAVASQSKYNSCDQAAASSYDAFVLTKAKYENGKANITEFNEAENRYVSASADLAQAKYEYLYQTALLNFYRGVQFTDF